jgi:hypothetical protein
MKRRRAEAEFRPRERGAQPDFCVFEPHRSFSIGRNIVDFDQGLLLGNNWKGGLKMDHNLYWDTRGQKIRPAGRRK